MAKIVGLVFEKNQTHICPYCGRPYKSAEALDRHINDKHKDATNGLGSLPAADDRGQE